MSTDASTAVGSPRITTIIPTFRRPHLLRRAIRSVLNQTYKDLKVWVCDNASGDETRHVVASFAACDPRVSYHCHSENIGAVENINYAMRAVNTQYLSILADDDILMPEFYAHAVSAFDNYPLAGCVCTRTLVYNSITNALMHKTKSWRSGYYEVSIDNVVHMIDDHFATPGVVFKAEVTDALGSLDRFGSDHVYMTRLANAYPFVILDDSGAIFTIHASSFSRTNSGRDETGAPGPWLIDATHYVEEWLLHFTSTVLAFQQWNISDRVRLLNAMLSLAKHTVIRKCVLSALQRKNDGTMGLAMDLLRPIRMPIVARAAFFLALRMLAQKGIAADLLARFASGLVFLRSVRRRLSRVPQCDAQAIEYLESFGAGGHGASVRAC
jgi:glycosyltransferase involved in cell wall biosynthesis